MNFNLRSLFPVDTRSAGQGAGWVFKYSARLLPAVLAALAPQVSAQEPSTRPTATPAHGLAAEGTSAPAEPCHCYTIPALTPVTVEILAALGSNTSKFGDTFPLRLAAPIVIDGKEVVPAGATGMGEVVHAKKSSGMGAAGELVLAARYVEIDGRHLSLRSLNFSTSGKSNIGQVDAFAVASAASPIPVGVLGFFITGGRITVAAGTVAQAKTREAFAQERQSATDAPLPAIASTKGVSE